MTYEEFDAHCAALPSTTKVVQWGGAHVWKVGGKVFAIGGWDAGVPAISFKVGRIAFEMLRDQPGLRGAPYMASRGMTWIQHYAEPGLSDPEIAEYLTDSHALVAAGLSRRLRAELGL